MFQEKKWSPGKIRGFAVLWAFFEGGGEKEGGSAWFFAGEFVVDCVVIVVGCVVIVGSEKYATEI